VTLKARKHAYPRRRAGLGALLEDSACSGASGNSFIRRGWVYQGS
jgi:hypothetical protein